MTQDANVDPNAVLNGDSGVAGDPQGSPSDESADAGSSSDGSVDLSTEVNLLKRELQLYKTQLSDAQAHIGRQGDELGQVRASQSQQGVDDETVALYQGYLNGNDGKTMLDANSRIAESVMYSKWIAPRQQSMKAHSETVRRDPALKDVSYLDVECYMADSDIQTHQVTTPTQMSKVMSAIHQQRNSGPDFDQRVNAAVEARLKQQRVKNNPSNATPANSTPPPAKEVNTTGAFAKSMLNSNSRGIFG